MLSDEEKKAIKILKVNPEIIADLDEEMFEKMCEFKEKSIKELKYWASQTALNLIEKQSKEIEELKQIIKENTILVKDENGDYQELNIDIKNYISKDKIKAKIEELKKQWIVDFGVMNTVDVAIHNGIIENKIEALQSLVEKE